MFQMLAFRLCVCFSVQKNILVYDKIIMQKNVAFDFCLYNQQKNFVEKNL